MWTLPLGGGDIKQNQRRQSHSGILGPIKRPVRAPVPPRAATQQATSQDVSALLSREHQTCLP
jgi:hypothetical protein